MIVKNELYIKYRSECFDKAYEILKKGNLKESYSNEKEIREDLKDIISLSDMIFDYIVEDLHPQIEVDNANL